MKKESVQILILSALLMSPAISIASDSSGSVAESVHLSNNKVNYKNIYTPGLGEIMTTTQMRHAKLWFAGKAGNWKLADYELYELKEGFDNAVKFHPNRSELLPKITAIPLEQLKSAISANDSARFKQAFEALTNSCNACHKETSFGFNVVIIPAINPYTNQNFEVEPETY